MQHSSLEPHFAHVDMEVYPSTCTAFLVSTPADSSATIVTRSLKASSQHSNTSSKAILKGIQVQSEVTPLSSLPSENAASPMQTLGLQPPRDTSQGSASVAPDITTAAQLLHQLSYKDIWTQATYGLPQQSSTPQRNITAALETGFPRRPF